MRNGNKEYMHSEKLQNLKTFYPTYEEWKLQRELRKLLPKQSFYPTYEEWKLVFFANVRSFTYALFILPMRNGNYLQFGRF